MIIIRILYASRVYYGINFWGVVVLLTLIFCVVRSLYALRDEEEPSILSTAIAMFAVIMLVFNIICAYSGTHPYSKSKMRYECLLEDGFTLENASQNYKIVEQRGDIVILEDR